MKSTIGDQPSSRTWLWPLVYLFLVGLGLVVAIKQAPFYIPDEGAHYLRAYEVSRLHLINVEGSVGTAMPCKDYAVVATKYHLIAWAQTKTLDEQNDPSCNVSTKNTAGAYSFLPYIPSAIALRIAESLGMSVEQRLIASRATGFVVWFTLIVLALLNLKDGRLLMGSLVLMPSFFWQLAAVSADGATLTSCLVYVLIVLRILQRKAPATRSDFALMLSVAALIGASKGVYAPLCLLSLAIWDLVPAIKPLRRLALLLTPMFVCLGIFALFTGLADKSLVFLGNGANPGLQAQHVLNHPFEFADAARKSILNMFNVGFISPTYAVPNAGRGFGINVFIILTCSVLIVFSKFTPPLKVRLLALSIALLLCFAVCLPLYLTYCPVGYGVILGLQSRYFLPILPLFFIALAFDVTKIDWGNLRSRFLWVALLPLIGLFLACMNIP